MPAHTPRYCGRRRLRAGSGMQGLGVIACRVDELRARRPEPEPDSGSYLTPTILELAAHQHRASPTRALATGQDAPL
ncbi:hypothetical protein FB451DRAFT_1394627 [Mycena latifolia]|nr:hypothetical protein FB451DRAFT_1394627 [Mycena latifolia]